MSWQVGGKEAAENVLALVFVIQQHSSVLAHRNSYLPLALPLSTACHREGSRGRVRDRAVAGHSVSKRSQAAGH